ncbi:Ditrans,polycis-undecaprenyl-diphosphate synthase ((2E,6E)-farnesyl-diphosphate specific) [Sporotomaculum syntrophicum]|uniref:Isoprenyl transferase n=1 Tax=Sporotomaculum syntrophicum TaxID=182264 RepID=A0A9D2WP85_9FIRM|nr:isoprenyl transferase [Sporotomaculum syntrophicum]KAF1084558.1 Ditrans,polycis-undecaprenyl-diphosphate synthase ((2E,6E)-farnesyl-diphosphate specific) [Sporotomaculum syntrophicum]
MFKRLLGDRSKNAVSEKKNLSEEELLKQLDMGKLPVHVAIIMDGNGRWATRRGAPRSFGHRAGVNALHEIVKLSVELKLKYLTVYAFSTENWKRPREEVNILMSLLVEYLNKEIDELCANNVRIHPMGILSELPEKAREAADMAIRRSNNNTGLFFNVAINYGGRAELLRAVQEIGQKIMYGTLKVEDINEQVIAAHLYTVGQPDPDLLIRPAGDCRVSNFLLWQLAYTELWLTDTMWPDFGRKEFLQALLDFQLRERRFGGLLHN